MSKQTVLSLAVPIEGHQGGVSQGDHKKVCSEVENLHTFRDCVFKLKEEVNRLSFMMSEIHDVLETSSGAGRFSI